MGWAVTKDGPALWQVPTPRDYKNSNKSQYIVCLIVFNIQACRDLLILILHFQSPIDIFESDFIIQTFAPFVRGCKGSCEDYGYLVGALALSATGVSDSDTQLCRSLANSEYEHL